MGRFRLGTAGCRHQWPGANSYHFSMAKMTVTEASRSMLGGKRVRGVVLTEDGIRLVVSKVAVSSLVKKPIGETELVIERISPSLTPACDAVLSAMALARFNAAA